MDKKGNIRNIEERDLDTIDSWWEDRGEKPILRDVLPEQGYGGFVLEVEGKIVAASYLYLTNSKMGYIDFVVSDKKWKGDERWELILELLYTCYYAGIDAGCIEVWGMSLVPRLLERLKTMNTVISEDPHTFIKMGLNPGDVKVTSGYSIYKNEIK